jgi:hypothetical protein
MMPSHDNNTKRSREESDKKNSDDRCLRSQRRLFDEGVSTTTHHPESMVNNATNTNNVDKSASARSALSTNTSYSSSTGKTINIERFFSKDAPIASSSSHASSTRHHQTNTTETTVVVGSTTASDAVIVTPDSATVLDNENSPGPSKRRRHQVSVVKKEPRTIDVDHDHMVLHDNDDVDEETCTYVPTYVHKNVGYRSKSSCRNNEGADGADPKIKIILDFIKTHFVIPSDFEGNRSKYGPLSGSSYEDRVIQAYTLGKLQRRENKSKSNNEDTNTPGTTTTTSLDICLQCVQIGHQRINCPTLI